MLAHSIARNFRNIANKKEIPYTKGINSSTLYCQQAKYVHFFKQNLPLTTFQHFTFNNRNSPTNSIRNYSTKEGEGEISEKEQDEMDKTTQLVKSLSEKVITSEEYKKLLYEKFGDKKEKLTELGEFLKSEIEVHFDTIIESHIFSYHIYKR